MALLKKPLGWGGSACTSGPGIEPAAPEPYGTTGRTARRASPLAARTAALLQRLRAQQGPGAERRSICSAADSATQPVVAGADLNRIHLTGCLGSEPLLYDVGDHPIATLALACERRWQAVDGTIQLETTWLNLSAWEELAEQCGRLLHRGDRVYVEGTLHLWTEVQAPQSYACHTIIADRIVLLAAGSFGNERSLGSQ
jgi:single-strand DNA-binding protein